jgi:dienelactone hydrolase
MGGALTIVTMTHDPSIDAGCPFYGVPDLTSNKLENIKVPVYAHFGELDPLKGFSSPEDAKNLEEKGKAAGVNIKIK